MTDLRMIGAVAVVHNAAPELQDQDDEPPSYVADAEIVEVAHIITQTLRSRGVEATRYSLTGDPSPWLSTLRARGITHIFNLVEGIDGDASREAEFAHQCVRHGLWTTGSPASALALAFRKDHARRVLGAADVPLASGALIERAEQLIEAPCPSFPGPWFIKPACADGSIGIDAGSVVRDAQAYQTRVRWLLARGLGPCLVERYLPGPELNVAMFPSPQGPRFAVTAIDFSGYPAHIAPIVSYDCKWTPGSPEYVARSVDARELVDSDTVERARQTAQRAILALGARSVARVDLRLDEGGCPRVIDVNPNPDLHPEAGLACAAAMAGLPYDALLLDILQDAHPPLTRQDPPYDLVRRHHATRARQRSRAARHIVAAH